MNEKIRELAIKSGGHPNIRKFRGHILPPPPDYIDSETVDLNQFAELIIKECIDILNPEGDLTSMREEYGRKLSMNMIKEHFGVEE